MHLLDIAIEGKVGENAFDRNELSMQQNLLIAPLLKAGFNVDDFQKITGHSKKVAVKASNISYKNISIKTRRVLVFHYS